MQDLLQWQQSYAVPQPQPAQTQGEVEEGEEIGDSETKVVTLSRDLLLQAKAAPDGLPVDVGMFRYLFVYNTNPCTKNGCLTLLFYALLVVFYLHHLTNYNDMQDFLKFIKRMLMYVVYLYLFLANILVQKQRREEQKAVRLALTGDTKRTAVTINDASLLLFFLHLHC